MINKFKKNKQGKIFVLMAVIITLLAIVFLMLISATLKKASEEVIGSHQKAMITTLNTKDSILLYLDESALLAKKEALQSVLAENAGYFERTGVGSQDYDVTSYGTYIYPLISNGTNLSKNFDYETEYLKLFRTKLLEYTSKNSYLKNKEFSNIHISGGEIIASAESPQVELLITSDEIIESYALDNAVMNLEIYSKYAKSIVNKMKKTDITAEKFADLKAGDCSAFISRLLDEAYSTSTGQNPVACLPNNAWDVAACYLYSAQNNPSSSRIVYAGKGLSYDELLSVDDLLNPGDILFTTSSAWGVYSGYNSYADSGVGFDNFCKPDSFSNPESQFPKYCTYNDETNEYYHIYYEDYPIITHIFMYLGEENDEHEHIIANLFNTKSINENLKSFLDNPSTGGDGVRIIVRPNYPKT